MAFQNDAFERCLLAIFLLDALFSGEASTLGALREVDPFGPGGASARAKAPREAGREPARAGLWSFERLFESLFQARIGTGYSSRPRDHVDLERKVRYKDDRGSTATTKAPQSYFRTGPDSIRANPAVYFNS